MASYDVGVMRRNGSPPTPAFGGGTFPPLCGGTDMPWSCGPPPRVNAATFVVDELEAVPQGQPGTDSAQRGSVTIWGIGLTLVIALFAGLVIDTWRVFAIRQDLAGMADAAAIAGATAVDIDHLNDTGDVILAGEAAEFRALEYLEYQDGWSSDIRYTIVAAADGSGVTVVLEEDVDFTLLGPLLPGEEPLHITVTSRASPNVVAP